jgi:hypothetical protein
MIVVLRIMSQNRVKVVLHQSTPALSAPDAGPVYGGPVTGKLIGGPRIRVAVDRRGRATIKVPARKSMGTTMIFAASDPIQKAPSLDFGEHLKPVKKSRRKRK